jgi:hypothetical protein
MAKTKTGVPGRVYLVCMSRPVCAHRPARHYLGWTHAGRAPEDRLAEHRAGRGARILAAAAARGIGLAVVRTWDGDRNLERKLKNQKNAKVLCPNCRPAVLVVRRGRRKASPKCGRA